MLYWAPPPAEVALSISYITYGDQLCMTVMADRNVLPNHNLLPALFTVEVHALKLSVLIPFSAFCAFCEERRHGYNELRNQRTQRRLMPKTQPCVFLKTHPKMRSSENSSQILVASNQNAAEC